MRKKEGETRAKRSMFYANGIRVFRARFFRPTTQFRCLLFTVLFSLLLIIRNKRKGGNERNTLILEGGSWGTRSHRRWSFARVRKFYGVMIILLVFNFKWASQRSCRCFFFNDDWNCLVWDSRGGKPTWESQSFSKRCNFREKGSSLLCRRKLFATLLYGGNMVRLCRG